MNYLFKPIFLCVVLLFAIIGCTEVHPSKILLKYQKKPFLQTWESEPLVLNAQLLPLNAMIAFKALQNYGDTVSRQQWDSLKNESRNEVLSIRLRLEPSEKIRDTLYANNSDVVYGFGQSADERSQTIEKFNFGLSKSVWLLIDGTKVFPALCHTEQVFGLENGRNIWLSFNLTQEEQKKLLQQETVVLFFQLTSPLKCVAQLEWPSSVIKKCM